MIIITSWAKLASRQKRLISDSHRSNTEELSTSTHKMFLADTKHQLNKDLLGSLWRAVKRLWYCHQQLITETFRHRPTHIRIHLQALSYVHMRTPSGTVLLTHAYTFRHRPMHTYTHLQASSYTHTVTHIHLQASSYAHTRTHTQLL